jgi:hypothetical protein
MRHLPLSFHKYTCATLFIGFVFIITIESSLSIQLDNFLSNDGITEEALAQSPSTNTSLIINDNSAEQNKYKSTWPFCE